MADERFVYHLEVAPGCQLEASRGAGLAVERGLDRGKHASAGDEVGPRECAALARRGLGHLDELRRRHELLSSGSGLRSRYSNGRSGT
jgi:hypothetical protein